MTKKTKLSPYEKQLELLNDQLPKILAEVDEDGDTLFEGKWIAFLNGVSWTFENEEKAMKFAEGDMCVESGLLVARISERGIKVIERTLLEEGGMKCSVNVVSLKKPGVFARIKQAFA